MAQEKGLNIGDLEGRIKQLEVRFQDLMRRPDLAAFSAGDCTNTCTSSCTNNCTNGCTGTCAFDPGLLDNPVVREGGGR
jgi:hypothetical protein